jgi:DNA-binding GntR family transcriptional regulator
LPRSGVFRRSGAFRPPEEALRPGRSQTAIENARDVFFARSTIEGRLVERLCATVGPGDIARLGESRLVLEEEPEGSKDLRAILG